MPVNPFQIVKAHHLYGKITKGADVYARGEAWRWSEDTLRNLTFREPLTKYVNWGLPRSVLPKNPKRIVEEMEQITAAVSDRCSELPPRDRQLLKDWLEPQITKNRDKVETVEHMLEHFGKTTDHAYLDAFLAREKWALMTFVDQSLTRDQRPEI
jgi:hypothetical protein